ncbi:hypothetical protein MCOR28_004683 [Pyricularia oryzae]|nr:hypothetical protein MCOR19_007177 [Pyricularia oryzae]KAI6284705.1 hypothetical protein MCOR26_001831 [Pyricularia oryzae]KAI6343594.1 hypothetical protein MCOR28_004683 [Pyricularia oryzae]KAI6356846.1 hypothetical protein MCOR32_009931 [Pyricularia oryzae]KAI6447935.1 hypothetical protein MCOR22_003086 [Pyricularia oryzae]
MGGVASIPSTDPGCTLQVIGAGFSRTGTVSMALALEKLLGGPVCHGGTQMHMLGDEYARRWVEVYEARHDRPELLRRLREVTRGFVGITDMPGVHFVEELLELYPEARVVGVRRDADRWWKSANEMHDKMTPWYMDVLLWPVPTSRWFARWHELAMERTKELGLLPFGPEYLDRYNDWVSRVVPEEKIVWMEMKDEWGPLCKMLDKPKPDLPFPRANDAEAAEGLIREKVKKATFIWSGIIGAVAISAAVAHRIYRRT